MVTWNLIFSKLALKDAEKLAACNLDKKAKNLLDILKINPFQTPPSCEKLLGNLSSNYSRRINHKHRLVYSVDELKKEITVLRMWTHHD